MVITWFLSRPTPQVCHAGLQAVIGNRALSPALVLVAGSAFIFFLRLENVDGRRR